MWIKWLGHATFLITSDAGTKIITDPYTTGGNFGYEEISEAADIVTVSHDHFDHNNVASVSGNPEVVKGTGTKQVKGIAFKGIPTHHDESGGSQRGSNVIFCFEVDGVKVCHLGDLGHRLDDRQVGEIGETGILFPPVGGFYTIDAKVAAEVCDKLKPKVIIPMHFRNERCSSFPVSGVDDFLAGKSNVDRLDTSEVEYKRGELPSATTIVVLKPAL